VRGINLPLERSLFNTTTLDCLPVPKNWRGAIATTTRLRKESVEKFREKTKLGPNLRCSCRRQPRIGHPQLLHAAVLLPAGGAERPPGRIGGPDGGGGRESGRVVGESYEKLRF